MYIYIKDPNDHYDVTSVIYNKDSGENLMFPDTSYISSGMPRASSKRQQVALEYVKQAAARRTRIRTASSNSSNEQCSKQQQQQQQQHHKQP